MKFSLAETLVKEVEEIEHRKRTTCVKLYNTMINCLHGAEPRNIWSYLLIGRRHRHDGLYDDDNYGTEER